MTDKELFAAALAVVDPAARSAFLQSVRLEDEEQLHRVESALALHEANNRLPPTAMLVKQPSDGNASTIVSDKAAVQVDSDNSVQPGLAVSESAAHNRDHRPEEPRPSYLQPSARPGSIGRLAHYEILEVLGQGAFGTVYKATDEKLERVVAIKVMAPELAATSPARKRFLREARTAAAIRHENVVSIYAVEESPIPYLVMEYIPGETLQHRLDERGPLDVPDVLRLGRQIAEGLAAAHARELIHRDVKPGNILLETAHRDRVKITDFGLARAADDASVTQSGTIAGTPMYMAPEQACGNHLDQRADLFSLGSVLYQMVSGRPPFRAPSTFAVLKRVAEDSPRPITEIIPETPSWLCAIISKLHAKDPNDRYQSAQEVADLLANCEAHLKSGAGSQEFAFIRPSQPQQKRSAPGWWKWVAAAALLLPVIALGVHFLTPESQSKTSQTNKLPADESSQKSLPDVEEPRPATISLAIAPFDADQARQLQERCARQLGVPVETMNSIGMKLMLIPPGKFAMPQDRQVTISKPFRIAAHETTMRQFRIFADETGFRTDAEKLGNGLVKYLAKPAESGPQFTWLHPDVARGSDHPVGQLSWRDAVAFCGWLSHKEGRTYRLPTDAEWQWACIAGTSTNKFFFGDDENQLADYAWYDVNSDDRSHPIGQKKPNAWGLFDLYGNICEYCVDWYEDLPNGDFVDPTGPDSGQFRATRGMGYFDEAGNLESARCRGAYPADASMNHFGFRVVCEESAVGRN